MLTGKNAGDIINLNSDGCSLPLLMKVVRRVGLYQWGEAYPGLKFKACPKNLRGGFESMKNLKKLLAVIVSICVLATFTVPAFAAETTKTDAAICADLGVLKGDGSGVTADYLAKGTTRLQAAILYLRLIGKEAEALAFTGTETFADADEVDWVGGKAILAYLKAHPELGWVGDGTNFDPNGAASAQMLYKVALEALGYKQGTDFQYADTITFAATLGLTKVATIAELTNDNTATALVELLKTKLKDGTMTLVEKLAASDATLKAAAIADGLIVEDVTAVAAQISGTKFTVTFNKEVDTTKATFALKKGTIAVNLKSTTWDEAKKVATLEMYAAATDGDYTITVGGLDLKVTTYTVAAKAPVVAKIEFANNTLVKTGATDATATVGYKVLDQFGTDITSATAIGGTGLSVSTTATGGAVLADKKVTVTFGSSPKAGDTTIVTIIHGSTAVFTTGTLTVADPATVASVALSELKNKDNKVLRIGTNLTDNVFAFDVTAKDQYGNTIGTDTVLESDLMVVPSNSAITYDFVSSTSSAPAKLKLLAVPASAGTYTITVIAKSNGASAVVSFKVEENVALASLTMSAPADILVKGESVYVPFTAIDQYGNALTKFDDITGKVTFTVADADAVNPCTAVLDKNNLDGTARIKLTAPAANTSSTIVVTSIVSAKAQTSQISVAVKAKAVPTSIVGLKDAVTGFTNGGTSTFAKGNILLKDQYGRDISLADPYVIKITADDGTFNTVTKTGTDVTTSASVIFTGTSTKGSEAVTAVLNDGTNNIASSSYSFSVSTVAKADIVSYVLDTSDTLYATGTVYASASAEQKAYAKSLSIYGKTAADTKVALKPEDILNRTSTNANLELVEANAKVYAKGLATADKDEVATLVVSIAGANGVQTVTKNITLTDKAKAGGEIAVKGTSGTYTTKDANVFVVTIAQVNAFVNKVLSSEAQYATTPNRAGVYFEVKDQYGVASAAVKPVYFTLTATNAAGTAITTYTIGTDGTLTAAAPVAGDNVIITAIDKNGAVQTIKLIVIA